MGIVKGIKAKLRNKENLPAWFDERVAICDTCPKNSKNNDKISLKDKVRISHNLGKDACLVCSCGILDLASDPTVKCSDDPPRWDWIRVPEFDEKYNLENHSPSMGKLIRKKEDYSFDFGKVEYKADILAKLFLVAENEYTNFKVLAGCGCTTPKHSRVEGGYKIEVSYDTKIVGQFEKSIAIIFNDENGDPEFLTFFIKGVVRRAPE